MVLPEAICFDLGYTLMHHAPSGPELYRRILEEAGYPFEKQTLEVAHRPAREMYARATREGCDFESNMVDALSFWTEYNLILLGGLGVAEADQPRLARLIATTSWSPESWQLFPDALQTLGALRERGLRLAIISNFVDTLGALCDLHELTPLFRRGGRVGGGGAMKPDARIFRRALHRLGVDPGQAWHVGDNYWADVLGARAAGMTPVLIDRQGLVPRPDCAVVRGLGELLPLLDAADSEAA